VFVTDIERIASKPKPHRAVQGEKLRGAEKLAPIPIKVIPAETMPRKHDWIRVRIPVSPKISEIKQKRRKHSLHTVCAEANGPNLGKFFGGMAKFMIMGDTCTRRCP
jgi:lipoic acid synthetase